jgi:putative flippase GtrA
VPSELAVPSDVAVADERSAPGRFGRLPWRRLTRYTLGSVICFLVAEVVLVVAFRTGVLGARGASVAGSVAGIVPGYLLNRRWTWSRRDRSDFWREVAPYWITALLSTAIAAAAIGIANAAFADQSRGTRTVINAATYCAVYGVLFVVKFVVFDWLFRPRETEPASS